MKDLRVTKIVKEINFEGVWNELESKKCFQRQSVAKYLRLTLVSCEIARHGKSLIAIFRDLFASTNKIFILAGGLGTRISFYEVYTLS